MQIGITGYRGVLGTIIRKQLDEMRVSYVSFKGDITNTKDINDWLEHSDFTHIIHLAALVATDAVNRDFKRAVGINVQGSVNLMQSIEKLCLRPHIFYASTCHVYKSSPVPLKETDTIEPINSYGMTKYIAEVLMENYAEKGGLTLCTGRIFSFYHHTQKVPFLYPSMLKRISEENLDAPFVLRGALSVRDLSNAEDICKFILKLVFKGSSGVFNIGSGKGISIQDFVRSLVSRPINFSINTEEERQFLVADISKLNEEINK